MTISKRKIVENWLTMEKQKQNSYLYVAFCLKKCPYSEEASLLFSKNKRKIIWITHNSPLFYKLKQLYVHKTYPICLAVPTKHDKANMVEKKPIGTIRLGGYSDVKLLMDRVNINTHITTTS